MPICHTERAAAAFSQTQQNLIERRHVVTLADTGESRVTNSVISTIVESVIIKRKVRSRAIPTRLGRGLLILPTDLDGVVALQPSKVFLPVKSCVGTCNDRIALHPTDDSVASISKIPEVIHSRYAEILRILWTGAKRTSVQSKVCRIDVVVNTNTL